MVLGLNDVLSVLADSQCSTMYCRSAATSNDHDIDHGSAMPDRRHFLAAGLGLAAAPLLAHVAAGAPLSLHPEVHMEIKRSGSQPRAVDRLSLDE